MKPLDPKCLNFFVSATIKFAHLCQLLHNITDVCVSGILLNINVTLLYQLL